MAAQIDRKSLAFKKLLLTISDGLGGENVRSLKNLCYEYLSAQQREQITNGFDIFNVLREQRKNINPIL